MVRSKKVPNMKHNHNCFTREDCLFSQNDVKMSILTVKNFGVNILGKWTKGICVCDFVRGGMQM